MATNTVSSNSSTTSSPYQLDIDQTLKASQALLSHFRSEAKRLRAKTSKQDLLKTEDSDSDPDGEGSVGDDQPIWLNLTTKQHIVDKHRLAPSKVKVPHSLTTSNNLSICLITADPQRSAKNVVADPAFPKQLSTKISKIIGYKKLKARYSSFESRRSLRDEYDMFLADDRIVNRLPETLGKVFYKGTAKRPIAVRIAYQERVDGKLVKQHATKKTSNDKPSAAFASPAVFAKEIEATIDAVPVYLRPGTSVAIRVGLASFTPQQLVENIEIVVRAVIEKHVVKGWKNVKTIHIKSPKSVAMPIWMADDMWTGDEDVIEDVADGDQQERVDDTKAQKKRKRNPTSTTGPQAGSRKKNRVDKIEDKVGEEEKAATAARKAKLTEQKIKAFKDRTAPTGVPTVA